jgi:ATP-dependent Lon protease
MQLDALDQLAAQAFDGFIVRKDLVRRFKGHQYPVPTYVGEFLLGRYCSSTDEAEIQEGLEIVQRQLASRTVRAGEEELFKARAKEQGRVKLIALITARLDARNDCFVAELPSLRSKDVRIEDVLVHSHERRPTSSASATCWVPCRRRCATTPPSWIASTPMCRAGTCPRSTATS